MRFEYIDLYDSLSNKALNNFSLITMGYEQCPPNYGYGPRVRDYHLIHFVFKGTGYLQINKMEIPVRAPAAFIIPSNMISYYYTTKTDPWKYGWIGFNGVSSDSFVRTLANSSEKHFVITSVNPEKYEPLLMEGAKLSSKNYASHLRSHSILMEILALLAFDFSLDFPAHMKGSVSDDIKLYIDSRYTEIKNLKDIATIFHVHPNYLTKIFKEHFGLTPKKYIISLRLKKACQLLEKTAMPIHLVSDAVGFYDQLAFSKCFKGEFQITPSKYREQLT